MPNRCRSGVRLCNGIEGELLGESRVQILHVANLDKSVEFYNLDVIISVGYRVKSKRGTQFRI
ncbi:MAG: virulence RhuM family protein [Lachnospiraceae bacterium]|nr:virulence RhuM family protein [Lachnospiraceae bacterium]